MKLALTSFSRLDVLPLEQQPPDLRQDLVGVRSIGVLRGTGPDGAFVQHDTLLVHAAKHHRPDASVAERQRLVKTGRWSVEPERWSLELLSGVQGGEQKGDQRADPDRDKEFVPKAA